MASAHTAPLATGVVGVKKKNKFVPIGALQPTETDVRRLSIVHDP